MHGWVDLSQFLKEWTPSNFNWFLHTMLFYHTKHVWKGRSRKTTAGLIMVMIVMKRMNEKWSEK